ncbi:MAG TPA: cytochrome C oxidase subunit IV family protein [Candidatus Saccharimonadales bacterium]|nr:cytochrome C oxidase subunit IV family protein [Candidatus Saccharimonadales bacterium]
MSPQKDVVYSEHTPHAIALGRYVTGFVLSIVCTMLAYEAVVSQQFRRVQMIIGLLVLAVVQFFVQIYFFLHLGQETRPRWKLFLLAIMITVLLILVLGSIWIMYNLNYRMTPQQLQHYLNVQDGGI